MVDPILAAAFTTGGISMIYWACAVVGLGLLIVSTLGASDADVDVDVGLNADVDIDVSADVGVDADVDLAPDLHTDAAGGADADVAHDHPAETGLAGDASSLATWFSIRFVVFFLAAFGALGVVLTYLTDIGPPTVFIVSLVVGAVAGQAVHHLFRKIQRTSGNTAPSAADYENKIARVTVAVGHSQKGEITLNVRGGQRYVPALARRPDATFKIGDCVAVVSYRGGAAQVVAREEFEFMKDTEKGATT